MTADWRDRIVWRRRELERAIKRSLERAARAVLAGRTPSFADLESLRTSRVELALLAMVEREAESIETESEGVW